MFSPDERRVFDVILSNLGLDGKLFVLHSLADGDAIASGYVMSKVFGGKCVIPDTMSSSGKRVAEILGFQPKILNEDHLNENDHIFLLDVSTPSRIGPLGKMIKKPIIIDHHTSPTGFDTPHYYCFPKRSSTSEIVFDILDHAGKGMGPMIMKAILLGIITDTGSLRFANSRTFIIISRILDSLDTTLEPFMDALEEEEGPGKNIARLKASQRMRYGRVGEFVIARSYVSCFESSACRALLYAGADAALVASGEKGNFRITARARERLTRKGLDLGNFFQSISKTLPGKGGGHAGAASFSGKGDFRKSLNIVFNRLIETIKALEHEKASHHPPGGETKN